LEPTVANDLRRDQGAAGRPQTQRWWRFCQLIALATSLAGIAIAIKWPDSWGVTLAFAGFFVAVVFEWIREK